MKAHVTPNGKIAMRYGSAVAEWRRTVTAAAIYEMEQRNRFEGPVLCTLDFWLPRPVGHFGTGKNAGRIKPSAPGWPAVPGDLDKFVRAVGDALTDAGVWRDDALVVALRAVKRYADDGQLVGVDVAVKELI